MNVTNLLKLSTIYIFFLNNILISQTFENLSSQPTIVTNQIEYICGQKLNQPFDCREDSSVQNIENVQKSIIDYTGDQNNFKGFENLYVLISKALTALPDQSNTCRPEDRDELIEYIHSICTNLYNNRNKNIVNKVVYRGLNMSSDSDWLITQNNLQEILSNNSVMLHKRFVSTTLDLGVAYNLFARGMLMQLLVRFNGKDISTISKIPAEKEILLPANSEFLIEKMEIYLPKFKAFLPKHRKRNMVVLIGQEVTVREVKLQAANINLAFQKTHEICEKYYDQTQKNTLCEVNCHETKSQNFTCAFYTWEKQELKIKDPNFPEMIKSGYYQNPLNCSGFKSENQSEDPKLWSVQKLPALFDIGIDIDKIDSRVAGENINQIQEKINFAHHEINRVKRALCPYIQEFENRSRRRTHE